MGEFDVPRLQVAVPRAARRPERIRGAGNSVLMSSTRRCRGDRPVAPTEQGRLYWRSGRTIFRPAAQHHPPSGVCSPLRRGDACVAPTTLGLSRDPGTGVSPPFGPAAWFAPSTPFEAPHVQGAGAGSVDSCGSRRRATGRLPLRRHAATSPVRTLRGEGVRRPHAAGRGSAWSGELPRHAAPPPTDSAGDESGRSPLPATRHLTHRDFSARKRRIMHEGDASPADRRTPMK